MSLGAINNYYERFQELFVGIDVKLIYIKQLDVDNTLMRITEERRTNDKTLYKDWIDHVIPYFEGSKYGKTKGYLGYEGALRYFKDRQNIELEVLKKMNIDKEVVCLDINYTEVLNKIISLI